MKYYVHTKTDKQGDHEVHSEGCNHMPLDENRVHLGDFTSCQSAVKEAKRRGYSADGCYWCSSECHTS
ncbi:hypothetical protein [Xenorhabdus bovienii]|uniref:Uncharacterized protein n=1 Tax=Xenorhabdus bovienii TaxID=40576 RepID=A0A0B6X928_XENBV|nr:hypothetical protein [Xenorhabdus bovienii]CDM89686.1 conserved protein of unknown function [Xenorhabdus bovienii]